MANAPAECFAHSLTLYPSPDYAALVFLIIVGTVVTITALTSFYFKCILGYGDKRFKTYDNGVSVLFFLRFLFTGGSYQSLAKITADCTRRRVYSGFRRFVFFGREIWTVGHPAVVKHIFGSKANLWYKVDKVTLNQILFTKGSANNAMLYTGDDANWKNTRHSLSPYFMLSNFEKINELVDTIVNKHLVRLLRYRNGRAELLELMLFVTVDLLCQTLYGASLALDDLTVLVESLAEYTVPATAHRGTYDGLNAQDYHTKVAREISSNAPKGTLANIILSECPSIPDELRHENCAFFLEALTPAFASFWSISQICMASATQADIVEKCIKNPIFRQQCIKESMRMYPPVPALWGRIAKKTHMFANPVYDETAKDERCFVAKLLTNPDIRTQSHITVKKDTIVFAIPAVLHHDDRFWMNPDEFNPSRWNEDPLVIKGSRLHESAFGGLALTNSLDTKNKIASVLKKSKEQPKEIHSHSAYDFQDHPIRVKLFGTKYEQDIDEWNFEHLKVASEAEKFSQWKFFPFGLGKHTCLGRRLAIQLVDAIVANTLSFGVNFENGVAPNLFKRHWTDRVCPINAVYYYPADPIWIEISTTQKDLKRMANERKMRTSIYNIQKLICNGESLYEESTMSTKSAVLFIDCQNEFLEPKGKLYGRVENVMEKLGTKKHIKEIMDAAIDSESLVIRAPVEMSNGEKFVSSGFDEWKHTKMKGLFVSGTWNWKFPENMGFTKNDIVINGRTTFDCTINTDLEHILRDNRIKRLFVAGFLTDACIETTITSLTEIFKNEIDIHPISDATAAYTMDAHQITFDHVFSKLVKPLTTLQAVEMLLEERK